MIPFEDHDLSRIVDWLSRDLPPSEKRYALPQTPAERVPCDTEDEWLAARRNGIGASEAGVIVGESSWCSPYALWYRKKLDWRLPRTEAQRWGHLVEDPIAELWAEDVADTLLVVKPLGHPYSLWRHPVRTWMLCTPDRLAIHGEGGVLPVELKSDEGGTGWGEPGTDQVPPHHRIQSMWQAHIFDAPGGWVVRRRGSGKGRIAAYWVPYDHSQLMLWATEAAEFLTSIELDRPPPPDGAKSTTETLKEIHPAIDAGEVVDVPGTLRAEWRMARLNKAAASRREAEVSNRLRAAMGRAEFAAVRGEVFVKRSISKRAGYAVGPGQTDELRKVGSEQRTADDGLRGPGEIPSADPGAGATPTQEGPGDGNPEGTGLGGVAGPAAGPEDPGGPALPDTPDALDELNIWTEVDTETGETTQVNMPPDIAALITRALNSDPSERVRPKHRPWSDLKHKRTAREQAEQDATTKES